jgi:TP901 family phage tail tape measure protein
MALSIGRIFGLLELEDRFSARLDAAAAQMTKFSSNIERAGQKISQIGDKITVSLTLPLAAAGGAALKFASDFESNMTKAVTLSGLTEEAAARMRDEILQLGPAVGAGPGELSRGLLVVTSTGLRGAEAMQVLGNAAKASAVGLGETDAVARAITAAINSYGKENLSAAQATDILYRTVKAGGAEATELAGVLGRVTGVASQVGVSFQEVGAFIATFTRLGVDAAEATTSLGAVMSTLLKPTQEAEDALKMAGTSIEALRIEVKEKGLTQSLLDLTARFKGNDDALAAIIPNVRALRGVMGTAGAQATTFKDVLAEVSNETDTLEKAFDRTTKNSAFKWDAFWAKVEKVAISAGDKIAPSFDKIVNAGLPLLNLLEDLIGLFAKLPEPVQTFVLGLGAIAIAAGPVMSWGGRLITMFGSIGTAIGAGATGVGAAGATAGFAAIMAGLAVPAALAGIAYGFYQIVGAVRSANTALAEGRFWEHIFTRQETWASRATGMYVAPPPTVSPGMTTWARGGGAQLPPQAAAPIPSAGVKQSTTPFGDDLAKAANDIKNMKMSSADLTAAIKSGAFGMEELKTKSGLSEVALKLFHTRVEKTTEASKKAAAELKKFNEVMKDYHAMTSLSIASPLDRMPGFEIEMKMPEGGWASAHWVEWAKMQKESRDRALVDQFSGKLPGTVFEIEMPPKPPTFWQNAFGGKAEMGIGIANAIQGAIQGGGDVMSAAASYMASGLTTGFAKHLTTGLTPALTGGWAKAVNAALPAIGALAGPLIDHFSKSTNKAVSAAATAGQWALAGAAFGPWGAAIGGATGLIIGLLKDEEKKVNPIRDKFIQQFGPAGLGAGSGFHNLAGTLKEITGTQELFNALMKADTMKEYEAAVQGINTALGQQLEKENALAAQQAEKTVPSYNEVKAAADRYGLSVDGLGHAIHGIKFTEIANQAVVDWNVMQAAGADMTVVAKGMADEVQELVTQSIKYGHELPASLKPIAQSMVDLGLLTAANGTKLENLEDVSWATPIEKAVGTLIKTMQEFVDTIAGKNGAVGAISKLGQTQVKPIRVPYYYDQEGEGPSEHGRVHGGPAEGDQVQNINVNLPEGPIIRTVVRGAPRELNVQGVG